MLRGEFGKQHAHQLGSDEIIGPILHGQHGQRAADVALDERGLLALLFRGLAPGCCGLGLCHRFLPSSSLAPPSPGCVQIDDHHNPKDGNGKNKTGRSAGSRSATELATLKYSHKLNEDMKMAG